MKKIIIFQLIILIPAFFGVWLLVFPDTIWWMEGNSFFSTLPDFWKLQVHFPDDLLKYAGAFLLQFYKYTVPGALLQTFFAVFILVCTDIILFCLFRNKYLLWASFIAVALFVAGQYQDFTLERSLRWCAVALLLAVVCLIVRKKQKNIFFRYNLLESPFFVYLVPCLIMAGSVYLLINKQENKKHNSFSRLEHLAERGSWMKILEEVSPQMAGKDPLKLRYALLALSEKGQLPEVMFQYGANAPGCFIFEQRDEPFCRNFNALFYRSLGFGNEVIHQSFQTGIRAPFGYTFRMLRRYTDIYLAQGNYALAHKYLEIMSHTFCYGKWVKMRLPVLENIKKEGKSSSNPGKNFFIGGRTFLSDMAHTVEGYPGDKKSADILLCALLTTKDLNKFYQVFTFVAPKVYPTQTALPRYYEEALLLISTQKPEILKQFTISPKRIEEFKTFKIWMEQGEKNKLKINFKDSFWTYLYGIS